MTAPTLPGLARLLLFALTPVALGPTLARADGPLAIPMTPDRWTLSPDARIVEHRGVAAIEFGKTLMRAEAVLNGLTFTDGTIELDIEPAGSMGPAVGFRRRDAETYESFYVRGVPTCETAPDCLQYAPVVRGALLWDLYPAYQAPAPVNRGQWNRLKLVVAGRRLRVYVNGLRALQVDRLEGDAAAGGLVLQGMGYAANLRVTPNATEDLPRTAAADPTVRDGRTVRQWLASGVATLDPGVEANLAMAPADRAAWTPIEAETGGLVNLSRRHGWPPDRRSLVWLRTTLRAARKAETRAAIGWNDEVWVFVNGRPVFADKNEYQKTELRKKPDGRLSLDNGVLTLPLEAGDNDVVIGVANAFFGWGLMLRLEDAAGVTLATPTR